MYVNTVLQADIGEAAASRSNTQNLAFGSHSNGSTLFFNGAVDGVRIYKRALSTAEITQLYNESIPVGIPTVSNHNTFLIYPNPASNGINITISAFDNSKTSSVEIYNIIGESVHRQIIKSLNCQIDISDLSNGVYFITVTNGEESSTEKIIVNK